MLLDNDHITISSRKTSKNMSEIALTHKHLADLFGEVKTTILHNKTASINAIVYEKGGVKFHEEFDIEWTNYKLSGVPYKIAIANLQNELVAKVRAMMHEMALKREVVPEDRASFTEMFENACKAFPHLSREQGMHLVLDALKAKRKRLILEEVDACELLG